MVLKSNLNLCMEGPDAYNKSPKIIAECLHHTKLFKVYSFKINPRQWKLHSPTNRFAEVDLSNAMDGLTPPCKTIVFMEAAVKYAKLPFVYYQFNKAISITANMEAERLYVRLSGNFVINVHASYHFIVLFLQTKIPAKYKDVNWSNYESVKKKFKLSQADKTSPS